MRTIVSLTLVSSIFLSVPCLAADGKMPCDTTLDKANGCTPAPSAFKGLKWGVALVYSSEKGGVGDVVKDSNNIVRVKKENQAAARGAFELHYFFPTKTNPSFGWGPFVSLNTKPVDNLSGGNFFSSVGAGLMVGVDAFSGVEGSSINLGLGYLIDTEVKELAPGVAAGQATSLNADELTNSTTKGGFMAILSYKANLN